MGIWSEEVLPRATDVLLDSPACRRWRREVVRGLRGVVVELGFGSGLNMAWYPPEVTTVLAVEPSPVALRLARRRTAQCPIEVRHAGTDAQSLEIDSTSVDAVLSTFTMCTVPQPAAALHEVWRVLRPRGAFHFLEHGLAAEPGTARWQHRLTPLQRRIAGGCHLDRDIGALVRAAPFEECAVRREYLSGYSRLRPWTTLYVGAADKGGPG